MMDVKKFVREYFNYSWWIDEHVTLTAGMLETMIRIAIKQDRKEHGFTCDSCGRECNMKNGKLYCDKCLLKTVIEFGIDAAEKEES